MGPAAPAINSIFALIPRFNETNTAAIFLIGRHANQALLVVGRGYAFEDRKITRAGAADIPDVIPAAKKAYLEDLSFHLW
jgi:ABC-type branched-subunit amino acid transport system ATPase component